MNSLTHEQIAGMMDISLLHPKFTRDDIDRMIDEAVRYGMASVCAKGYDVAYCAKKLQGTGVKVGGSAAFPHGNSSTRSKVYEVLANIEDGASEVDVVLPIGLVRSGMMDYAKLELSQILDAAHKNGAIVKVIFENAYLTPDEIAACCEICNAVDADFVKTSTGYAPSGAKLDDVKLMRKLAKPEIQAKAAGGIRTLDDFMAFYGAGCTRIGTSSATAIVDEAAKRGL
jgi:deoxyribose-phosphate aldolase